MNIDEEIIRLVRQLRPPSDPQLAVAVEVDGDKYRIWSAGPYADGCLSEHEWRLKYLPEIDAEIDRLYAELAKLRRAGADLAETRERIRQRQQIVADCLGEPA